jgi:hypothetical protein
MLTFFGYYGPLLPQKIGFGDRATSTIAELLFMHNLDVDAN